MTVSGADIWRTAKLILERHGDEAEAHADQHVAELLAAPDEAGAATWRKIKRAIVWLRRESPRCARQH